MKIARSLLAFAVAAAALPASALQYDFNTVLTGDTPGGTAPYARLTVTQAGIDHVMLKLEALSLAPTEFISSLSYNIAGNAVTTGLAVYDDGTGGVGGSTYSFYGSPFTDASLQFDADVAFPTSNAGGGVSRFKNGESFTYTLNRAGLKVGDIDLDMMIHIQGIALAGGRDGSSKVTATLRDDNVPPVPDSGSALALLGVGVLGLGFWRRR